MGSSQSAEPVAPAPKPDAKVEIPAVAPVDAAIVDTHIADTLESLNTQSLISVEECNMLKREIVQFTDEAVRYGVRSQEQFE